ncbi:proteasome subunit beta [Candidatus Woesearchaeota archaeon]|nr:proteasome subunit beta [Candidatus Woesearchaeota archaeon]
MQKINTKRLQTGTTTVGIVCKDGIVLAADKRVSAGYRIAHKAFDKIHQISETMVVTTAGLVSDAQLITKLIKAELMLKKIRETREATVKEASNLLANIVYANVRRMSMVPGIVGFLLGGRDSEGFHLVEIGIDGSISFFDDYTSDGSGSDLAIGVLEASYNKNINVDEGIKLAIKSINSAIQRDMPTGSGLDVFTITDKGIKKVMTKTIETKIL